MNIIDWYHNHISINPNDDSLKWNKIEQEQITVNRILIRTYTFELNVICFISWNCVLFLRQPYRSLEKLNKKKKKDSKSDIHMNASPSMIWQDLKRAKMNEPNKNKRKKFIRKKKQKPPQVIKFNGIWCCKRKWQFITSFQVIQSSEFLLLLKPDLKFLPIWRKYSGSFVKLLLFISSFIVYVSSFSCLFIVFIFFCHSLSISLHPSIHARMCFVYMHYIQQNKNSQCLSSYLSWKKYVQNDLVKEIALLISLWFLSILRWNPFQPHNI